MILQRIRTILSKTFHSLEVDQKLWAQRSPVRSTVSEQVVYPGRSEVTAPRGRLIDQDLNVSVPKVVVNWVRWIRGRRAW